MDGSGLADDHSVGIDPKVLNEISRTLAGWLACGDAAMQFAMYRSGRLVLDLAYGTDPFTGRPVTRDSLFCILSASKGLAAVVGLAAHHERAFSWRDRVSKHWPGFSANGKGEATISDALSHRLGIPTLTAEWRRWPDQEHMARLVERSAPQWVPGSRFGYHGGTFGTVVLEIIRRTTSWTTGEWLRKISARTGHADCYLGMPPSELGRAVRLMYLEEGQKQGHPSEAFPPMGPDEVFNSSAILTADLPSSSAVASAVDLAGIYNLVALEGTYRGRTFWTPEEQRQATLALSNSQTETPAAPGLPDGAWGLGFMVAPSRRVFGTVAMSDQVAGHAGASGAVAYGDPATRTSVAFTINGMQGKRLLRRMQVLGDLVRRSLVSTHAD